MVCEYRECGNSMIPKLFAQNPEIPPGTQNISWDFGNLLRLLVPRGPNAPDLEICFTLKYTNAFLYTFRGFWRPWTQFRKKPTFPMKNHKMLRIWIPC